MGLTGAELETRIDALLRADDFGRDQWHTATGAAPVFRYQFEPVKRADFPWTNVADPVPFTEAEKTTIRAAFDAYEAVLNIRFQEVTGDPDPEFSVYNSPDLDTGSSAVIGGRGRWDYRGIDWDGSMVFHDARDLSNDYDLVVHELGHMLGLKHPGDYDVLSGGTPPPYLPLGEDNQKYTVMSYIDNPDTGADAAGLMVYDIAALQHFWGANTATAAGDDTHAPLTATDLHVIWDAGGVDTLAHTGAGQALLDLRQGAFSALNGEDLAVIAYGAVIENATGGAGDDRLYGNADDNALSGGAGRDILRGDDGDDRLQGGAGGDSLLGGAGSDWAVYGGTGLRADLANSGANLGEAAGDSFRSIENLEGGGARDLLYGNAGDNALTGRAGNDTLKGRAGADVLTGNAGADRLQGEVGADHLSGGGGRDMLEGGGGNDVLTGGPGRDLFVFDRGADVITDFNGDALSFDSALWGGAPLSAAEILDFARVHDGNVLFNFGAGNRLTIADYTDLNGLEAVTGFF